MYLEFYGLTEKPFNQTPDPRFLYWNDGYRETIASLTYGIRERKGFVTMIGEAGTGKTTLLRKLLDDLGSEVLSVFLFNPTRDLRGDPRVHPERVSGSPFHRDGSSPCCSG